MNTKTLTKYIFYIGLSLYLVGYLTLVAGSGGVRAQLALDDTTPGDTPDETPSQETETDTPETPASPPSDVFVNEGVTTSPTTGALTGAAFGLSIGNTSAVNTVNGLVGLNSSQMQDALLAQGFQPGKPDQRALGTVTTFEKEGTFVSVFSPKGDDVVVAVTTGEKGGNFERLVGNSPPGPGGTYCVFSASPRAGTAPLTVNFGLSYSSGGDGGCQPPEVSWGAPCNPPGSCSYTYDKPGIYGPYSASVRYRFQYDVDCRTETGPSCSSPAIVVVGSSPSPAVSPTPAARRGPSEPPPYMTFTANPTSIPRGGASTLTWTSQNTTDCTAYCVSGPCSEWGNPMFTLPFVSKPTSGSQKVTPPNTSTYRLNCFGLGGSVFQDTTVNVGVVKWREITPIF